MRRRNKHPFWLGLHPGSGTSPSAGSLARRESVTEHRFSFSSFSSSTRAVCLVRDRNPSSRRHCHLGTKPVGKCRPTNVVRTTQPRPGELVREATKRSVTLFGCRDVVPYNSQARPIGLSYSGSATARNSEKTKHSPASVQQCRHSTRPGSSVLSRGDDSHQA